MKNLFRSPRIWWVITLLLVVTGIAGYRQFFAAPAAPQYQTQAVELADLSQSVSANGTLNPVSLINVGTQVSGTVKKLYVDFNSKVERGQVLLELDDALLAAQQKQSSANVANAAAALELATANETRTRNLYTQEYVSRLELDTAVQAKKSAAAQLQASRAAAEKDRANIAYAVIRSPVSGVVIDRSVDVGQTVAASLQTPTLFKIAQDLSKMQIHANFAEADIGSIRVGQAVKFTVDAFAGKNFQGEVQQIRLNPTTLQNVVTYDVVVNVDNPEQLLMPGMTAYVNIAVNERKQVLVVPNAALRFKPAMPNADKRPVDTEPRSKKSDGFTGKVYVLKNGQPSEVKVSLGITDNRNTEIVGGALKAGDAVITGEAQNNGKPTANKPPTLRMF